MSDSDIQGYALVTGGSQGIGRAVMEALLQRNFRVHFCSRTAGSVDWTANELKHQYPGRVEGQAVDIRNWEQVADWVDSVSSQSPRIDCLVNNAGIGIFEPLDELSPKDWDRVIETNLSGAYYCLHAVTPHLKEQGRGTVFNIASLASRYPFAGGTAYNASKFGLLGLSEAAMLELRPFGIRVCAILPGSVDTEFRTAEEQDTTWKLRPQDVAKTVVDFMDYPDGALPNRIELRPMKTTGST